jgi:thiol-disulfide isomerase/thioredoxin
MKNLILIVLIINLCSCAFRNREKNLLPFFNLLLIDSVTIFNTSQIPEGRPIVLMYFSPDCEHCQRETEELISNMDSLKNVEFYFVSYDPFDRLKIFNSHYKLSKFPNIILGRDYSFFLSKHFNVKVTPYLAIYNKYKQLNIVYAGKGEIHEIIASLRNL